MRTVVQPITPPPAEQARMPWDRQPDEPAKWHGRFRAFLELGYRRTVLGVYRAEAVANRGETVGTKLRSAPTHWHQAATQFQWRERADAYDDYRRAEWEKKRRALIDEALERHLQQARLMQKRALEKLAARPGTDLKMKDAARMLLDGMKQELIALGVPAEIREQRHAGPEGKPHAVKPELHLYADDELRAELRALASAELERLRADPKRNPEGAEKGRPAAESDF